jgi:hypothetical protein
MSSIGPEEQLANIIHFRGDIHAEKFDLDGRLVEVRDIRNTVLNVGKNQLTTLSGKTGSSGREGYGWTVIATQSSVAAGDTTPAGPLHTATNAFTYNATGQYQASSSHTGITGTASSAWLYNSTSTLYLCGGTFSGIPLQPSDTLNIVYTISFT